MLGCLPDLIIATGHRARIESITATTIERFERPVDALISFRPIPIMKFYRLFIDIKDPYARITHTGFGFECIRDILHGKEIESISTARLTIENRSGHYPDVMGTGSSELFVRDRLKAFLQCKMPSRKIRFPEIEIAEEKYSLLNIVGLRGCMDHDHSTYTVFERTGLPDQITNLVIIDDMIDEFDLFRIHDKPQFVFATEPLKEEMESQAFTGIRFIDSMDLTFGG